ncbi:TOMM precursor leader peptide-binding protein [Kitasatospora sp. NPDC058965]|uniref:TOMM precursor leader peptide-binding protein n=1 Tax=Kitasatospora sp. NPDC058965 TaxID=3346682 RepID=UPI00369E52B1
MARAVQWDRVGVAGVGEFGAAVRDRCARTLGATALTVDQLTGGQPLPGAPEVLVVALWRPLEELGERIDEAAFAAGRPWLPVVLEDPRVVVGPWLAPPDGPCHRCYLARRAQHRPDSASARAVTEAYAADPQLGVSGHLPHHVRLAVGLAQQALRLRDPGLVLSAHTAGGRLSTHRTLGCHGCPRCGRQDRLGADGTVAELVRSLRRPAPSAAGSAR